MIWIFFVSITLIFLIFASISDLKTREVPDWLNYSLIAIGLGGRGIYSIIEKDYKILLYGIIGFGIFFIISNIMYFTKQWGGGDAKLLMGLGAMFGSYEGINILRPNLDIPFLAILLINILLAGTIYGILYSIFLAIKKRKEFAREFKKESQKELIIGAVLGLLLIAAGIFFNSILGYMIIIFGIIIAVFTLLYIFLKVIEKTCMIKYIDVNKLTEGDWIAENVKYKNKVICYAINKLDNEAAKRKTKKINELIENKLTFLPESVKKSLQNFFIRETSKYSNLGLTKQDIEKLKKHRIKKVLIKDGIPFVPSFLLGFLMTIIYGNLITILKVFS